MYCVVGRDLCIPTNEDQGGPYIRKVDVRRVRKISVREFSFGKKKVPKYTYIIPNTLRYLPSEGRFNGKYGSILVIDQEFFGVSR